MSMKAALLEELQKNPAKDPIELIKKMQTMLFANTKGEQGLMQNRAAIELLNTLAIELKKLEKDLKTESAKKENEHRISKDSLYREIGKVKNDLAQETSNLQNKLRDLKQREEALQAKNQEREKQVADKKSEIIAYNREIETNDKELERLRKIYPEDKKLLLLEPDERELQQKINEVVKSIKELDKYVKQYPEDDLLKGKKQKQENSLKELKSELDTKREFKALGIPIANIDRDKGAVKKYEPLFDVDKEIQEREQKKKLLEGKRKEASAALLQMAGGRSDNESENKALVKLRAEKAEVESRVIALQKELNKVKNKYNTLMPEPVKDLPVRFNAKVEELYTEQKQSEIKGKDVREFLDEGLKHFKKSTAEILSRSSTENDTQSSEEDEKPQKKPKKDVG